MLSGSLNILLVVTGNRGDNKQGWSVQGMVINQGDNNEDPVYMATNISIRKCQMDISIALELIIS